MSVQGNIGLPGDDSLQRIAASDLDRSFEEFLYDVSNDLRKTARVLVEVPHWLKSDMEEQGVRIGSDMRDDFALLDRHAAHLDQLLEDLLTFAHVGRLQEICRVPLRHFIERLLRENARSDHITVHFDVDLPAVVMGYRDGFLLFQALIDNAIRHGAQKEKILNIEARRFGTKTEIVFRDNGPGVAREDQQRIFRPLVKLVSKGSSASSGMGLAIVQRIAEHYNGHVSVGSDPDTLGLVVKVMLDDAGLVPFERMDWQDSSPAA